MPRLTFSELEEEVREAWRRVDDLYFELDNAKEYARMRDRELRGALHEKESVDNG